LWCHQETSNNGSLLAAEQTRLAQAKLSDKTVLIRTAEEVAAKAKYSYDSNKKTWHYKLKKMGSIMGIIISFILDGAKINLPSGKKSLVLSAYPVESDGNDAWDVLRNILKCLSKIILKDGYIPYPAATNVAGK
jgi:hypothetical protein